jgi:DNA-binding response OmpR family regulator
VLDICCSVYLDRDLHDADCAMRDDRLRILLAEDHPLCRWAVGSALVARGHDVATTASREETCARLFRERFDAVVLSSRMGGQDMTDVAAALCRYGAVPRLVVVCDDEDLGKVQQVAPLAACFTRPFALAALIDAIDPSGVETCLPKSGTFA